MKTTSKPPLPHSVVVNLENYPNHIRKVEDIIKYTMSSDTHGVHQAEVILERITDYLTFESGKVIGNRRSAEASGESKEYIENISKEVRSLRKALNNLYGNLDEFSRYFEWP